MFLHLLWLLLVAAAKSMVHTQEQAVLTTECDGPSFLFIRCGTTRPNSLWRSDDWVPNLLFICTVCTKKESF